MKLLHKFQIGTFLAWILSFLGTMTFYGPGNAFVYLVVAPAYAIASIIVLCFGALGVHIWKEFWMQAIACSVIAIMEVFFVGYILQKAYEFIKKDEGKTI